MNGRDFKNIGVKKKRWVVCFENAILDMDLSIYEKMVYIVLCSHAKKDGPCFPSVNTIAREASCSRAKVFDALKKLEAAGVISRRNQIFEGRGQTSNLYEILDIPDGASPNPSDNSNTSAPSTPETGDPRDGQGASTTQTGYPQGGRGASTAETGASTRGTGGVRDVDAPYKVLELSHMNNTKEVEKSPPTPQRGEEGKKNFKSPEPQSLEHDTGEKKKNPGTEGIPSEPSPYGVILNAFNEILPELPFAEKLTASRIKTLDSRIREDPARSDPEWWKRYFERVRLFPWLMGSNPSGWKAAIDWLIGEDGMRKVIEGAFTQAQRPEQSREEMREWQRRYTDERGIVDAKALLRDWRASVAGTACSGRC